MLKESAILISNIAPVKSFDSRDQQAEGFALCDHKNLVILSCFSGSRAVLITLHSSFRVVIQSDLVYPDYFVSCNNVGLAKYPDNRNRKYKE